MKFVIPIAASLALALAPAAYAQVTCSEISRLNASGLDDFDDIAEDEIDDEVYDTSFTLGGADECSIDYAFDSIYACLWVFDTYASASAALNSHFNAVASCLPAWTREALTSSAANSNGIRTLQGMTYAGAGGNADLEWAVYLEEHTFDATTDWHVWVGVAYLW
jgi:hypothetical protein